MDGQVLLWKGGLRRVRHGRRARPFSVHVAPWIAPTCPLSPSQQRNSMATGHRSRQITKPSAAACRLDAKHKKKRHRFPRPWTCSSVAPSPSPQGASRARVYFVDLLKRATSPRLCFFFYSGETRHLKAGGEGVQGKGRGERASQPQRHGAARPSGSPSSPVGFLCEE